MFMKAVQKIEEIQVTQDYEHDIALGGEDATKDFSADAVEYALKSMGLSAAEMQDALVVSPTESVAIEAMAEMLSNLGGMRSTLCNDNSSRMRFLCGSAEGILGEDLVKVMQNALLR